MTMCYVKEVTCSDKSIKLYHLTLQLCACFSVFSAIVLV